MLPSLPSISSSLSSRPPLALFLLSLLLLAVTCLSLALYVSTSDLPNPDVLDWARLLGEMAELRFCMSNTTAPSSASNSSLASVALASVSLAAPLAAAFRGRGAVPLDHMGLGHTGQQVEVTIAQVGATSEVCLEVRGAPEVLHHLATNTSGCGVEGAVLEYTAHTSAHLSSSWCSQGSPFTFSPAEGAVAPELLSAEERGVAAEHLLLTAGTLLLLGVVLACTAGGRGQQGGHDPPGHGGGGGVDGDLPPVHQPSCTPAPWGPLSWPSWRAAS